jgi:dienelactone hydrolase
MTVRTEVFEQWHDDVCCRGFLAYPHDAKIAPAVLIVHDWSGCNQLVKDRAIEFAHKGYVAYAVDMYGLGQTGQNNEEKQTLMMSILSDRQKLAERLNLFLDKLRNSPLVDPKNLFAIGFCFGGLCVLDLARSGAKLNGVVSFHGILVAPPMSVKKHISADILVLHGYEDPMIKPQEVVTFCDEMTKKGAKWEIDIFSNAKHSFTNPDAHDLQNGLVYDALVAKRAFDAMHAFFARLSQ